MGRGRGQGGAREGRERGDGGTHSTRSSTPKSFRQASALRIISFAFWTSNLRARRNLGGISTAIGLCTRGAGRADAPEERRVVHAVGDEGALCLELLLEGVERVLLGDGEVAEAAGERLVVGVGDAVGERGRARGGGCWGRHGGVWVGRWRVCCEDARVSERTRTRGGDQRRMGCDSASACAQGAGSPIISGEWHRVRRSHTGGCSPVAYGHAATMCARLTFLCRFFTRNGEQQSETRSATRALAFSGGAVPSAPRSSHTGKELLMAAGTGKLALRAALPVDPSRRCASSARNSSQAHTRTRLARFGSVATTVVGSLQAAHRRRCSDVRPLPCSR